MDPELEAVASVALLWVKQTFVFVESEGRLNAPVEVLEQIKIRADAFAERVFTGLGGKTAAQAIPIVVGRVLDWVVERRAPPTPGSRQP